MNQEKCCDKYYTDQNKNTALAWKSWHPNYEMREEVGLARWNGSSDTAAVRAAGYSSATLVVCFALLINTAAKLQRGEAHRGCTFCNLASELWGCRRRDLTSASGVQGGNGFWGVQAVQAVCFSTSAAGGSCEEERPAYFFAQRKVNSGSFWPCIFCWS